MGELVEQPADLSNALALNASITNGARLIGPALAGLVMVRSGGLCCLAGALVFARHLPALRAMVRPRSAHREILQDTTGREPTAMEVSLHAHHEP